MFVEGCNLAADLGKIEMVLLAGFEQRRVKEGHALVENGLVARHGNVMAGDQWKEIEVVGDAGADTASTRRMPPMLDVALFELARCRPEDLCTGFPRRSVDHGHRVL